ncbi:hypothetical protein JR316_0009396 [Psilocybe cubensis]|uniref:Uncharacterized protein n=2 Tax=Psilocybe cubensis TaxID=181762 RepID=A0A8H7XV92_PSICU|nr:hypothetical protein JR316_0009396 [Psilocybe cubensis]KAH9478933.1 hypothetical protein JR316_0009396 [Psilocybe cubensis]
MDHSSATSSPSTPLHTTLWLPPLDFEDSVEDSRDYLLIPPYSELPFGPDTLHYYLPRIPTDWPSDMFSLDGYTQNRADTDSGAETWNVTGAPLFPATSEGSSEHADHNTLSDVLPGQPQPSAVQTERQNNINKFGQGASQNTGRSGTSPVERNVEHSSPTTARSTRASKAKRKHTQRQGTSGERGLDTPETHARSDGGIQKKRRPARKAAAAPPPPRKGRIDSFGRVVIPGGRYDMKEYDPSTIQ